MTPEQISMARALALCSFVPGIGTKRFARDMASKANTFPESGLTEKQAKYLAEAVVRYRRQIPAEVVKLAQQALAEGASA